MSDRVTGDDGGLIYKKIQSKEISIDNYDELEINDHISTNREQEQEAGQEQIDAQRQQKINNTHANILGNMPPNFNATVDDVLKAIELKLAAVTRDTRRAARFDKVRNAVALYNLLTEPSDKYRALLGIREAAANYLIERGKRSYQDRKTLCENLVKSIDSFIDVAQIEKAHDPGFLIEKENIPDELLDAEIANAYKHVCADEKDYLTDFKDRRKAYNRKIKDVRLARRIKERMQAEDQAMEAVFNETNEKYSLQVNEDLPGYDEASDQVVMAYTKLYINNQEDTVRLMRILNVDKNGDPRLVQAKRNKIMEILMEIMSWDLKDFEFESPEEFLGGREKWVNREDRFIRLFNKLRLAANADFLLAELYRIEDGRCFLPNEHAEITARLSCYKKIAAEYETRLDIMSNPYYALLYEKDVSRFKKGGNINDLTADRNIPGVDSKIESSQAFRDYVDAVYYKYENLNSDINNDEKDPQGRVLGKGGGFTRKTDTQKMLAWHRKLTGARPVFDENDFKKYRIDSRISLMSDREFVNEYLGKN